MQVYSKSAMEGDDLPPSRASHNINEGQAADTQLERLVACSFWRVEKITLFEAQTDILNLLKIHQRIAVKNQKICLISSF